MNQQYPLVIFDWDGTLMDSKARITDCMLAAINSAGVAQRSHEQIHNIIGLGLREAMQALYPGEEDIWPRLIDAYRDHFLDENREDSKMFSGSVKLVRDLHERGHLLAIATGKARRGLDRVLQQTGLGEYFHASRCADESGSKPHPAMLNEILIELGLRAEQAVMVGDTEYDLKMAHNAGMDAIAVSYGAHDKQRLLSCAPSQCVDDVAQLASVLITK